MENVSEKYVTALCIKAVGIVHYFTKQNTETQSQ